jgi:hypothetical protein
MSLRSQQAVDALTVFARSDDFGETVTYYPEGLLYDPRPLTVLVSRNQPTAIPTDEGGFLMVDAVIRIPRGSGPGQLAAVALRRDLVDVILVEGEEPVRCRIPRKVDSDPSMWVLEATR